MYDGNIAVYDVKSRNKEAAIVSDGSNGKHSDPVWKIKWVDHGESASTLVSISTDGRVTRWKITKGLEHSTLMKLKRMARRTAAAVTPKMANVARNLKQEAFVSRLTAGTAFDFAPHDERIYIAGALLQRCVCNCNNCQCAAGIRIISVAVSAVLAASACLL
jgi:WD40 repeat protein